MTVVTGVLSNTNGTPLVGALVTAASSAKVTKAAGSASQIEVTAVTSHNGEWRMKVPPTGEGEGLPAGTYYTFTSSSGGLSENVYVPNLNRPTALGELPAAPGVGTITPTSLTIPTATAAPSSPAKGQMYYDTTKEELGIYSGTVWRYLFTE